MGPLTFTDTSYKDTVANADDHGCLECGKGSTILSHWQCGKIGFILFCHVLFVIISPDAETTERFCATKIVNKAYSPKQPGSLHGAQSTFPSSNA
jgi:hypothetical protein